MVETCVQGSVAMSTVVQNEDHDYDIDVAVVFDKSLLAIRALKLHEIWWRMRCEEKLSTSTQSLK